MKKVKTPVFIRLTILTVFFLVSASAWCDDLIQSFDQSMNDESLTLSPFSLSFSPVPPWVNPQYPEAKAATTTAQQLIQVLPVPFGGYQDTYGILLGAALALYDPATQTRLTTSYLTNFDGYSRYKAHFQWRRPNEWLFDVNASVGTDIQHYYGEGDETPDTFQSYQSGLDLMTVSFQYAVHPGVYIGPSVEYL